MVEHPNKASTLSLPTGTVTFLFTDIEGSTRLLNQLGAAYARVLAQYRRLLRNVFQNRGGKEVDTQGDAFFIAFIRAKDVLPDPEIRSGRNQRGP